MATSFKRLLVGSPKRTEQAAHERLTKKTALAVFSSDALSSTAYATQEILLVLAVAVTWSQHHGGGAQAFRYVIPVSLAIAALLIIVAISYRQTIFAYPSGGGAYIVAKDNLGTYAGLTAGAALLVDYVLTVSVSISAGVSAITSAAQDTRLSWLHEHKVALGLFFIALIAVANLRGVRESGAIFAAPTYVFLSSFLFMIGFGFVHYLVYGGAAPPPEELKIAEGYAAQPVTLFLLLGAFSNGCSALTGIEAISNGVPAFKRPEARNAAKTLVWMALLLTVMFLGTSVMAYLYGVHPSEKETVISQFARIMFTGPMGWFYYVVQAATTAILVLAANTSFADFPRLSSLLARDRYLPRQFANRGDRLVFSNGIVILSIFSGVLVAAFGADENRLIPLYAVGVFLSFTLSQSGMVVHWLRERDQLKRAPSATPHLTGGGTVSLGRSRGVAVPDPGLAVADIHASQDALRALGGSAPRASHWRKSIVINALGALATFVVLVVFVTTKFVHGAWVVVALIPVLVLFFRAIHEHYASVARQLTTEGLEKPRNIRHTVIVPISGIHRGVIGALEYAKAISGGNVRAVYVDIDEEATRKLREKWEQWGAGVKLVVLPSPYRSLIRPLLRYLNRVRRRGNVEIITVVLPEFVPARWWQHLLHNQSSLLLKGALLFRRGIIVTSVPYHLEK
ncbi:MAG: APC family permease [Acidobacteriota bacterium]|nr:APC family permease [Acidobacteriota bacterium]